MKILHMQHTLHLVCFYVCIYILNGKDLNIYKMDDPLLDEWYDTFIMMLIRIK